MITVLYLSSEALCRKNKPILLRASHAIARAMCRVTARGAFLPLQLFLHQNPDGSPSPTGWGVRCAVDVAAGTFLTSYTGTVAVNSEVPERRRYTMSLDHYTRACSTLSHRPEDLRTVPLPPDP